MSSSGSVELDVNVTDWPVFGVASETVKFAVGAAAKTTCANTKRRATAVPSASLLWRRGGLLGNAGSR
jgi:hypothetical protein